MRRWPPYLWLTVGAVPVTILALPLALLEVERAYVLGFTFTGMMMTLAGIGWQIISGRYRRWTHFPGVRMKLPAPTLVRLQAFAAHDQVVELKYCSVFWYGSHTWMVCARLGKRGYTTSPTVLHREDARLLWGLVQDDVYHKLGEKRRIQLEGA